MANFSERLRAFREAAGLSQESLARLAGITKDHVGKLERGEQENPTASTLEALSRALGIHPTQLLWEPTHDVLMESQTKNYAQEKNDLDAKGREMLKLWPNVSENLKKTFLEMARADVSINHRAPTPKKNRKAAG